MSISYIKETRGKLIYLKITGENRREILQEFYTFLNRGYVHHKELRDNTIDDNDIKDDTYFQWIVPDLSGYLITTDEELLKCFADRLLQRFLDAHDKNRELKEESEEYRRFQMSAQAIATQQVKRIAEEVIDSD